MLIVAAAILLTLGVVGVLISLWGPGRRMDSHPVCRGCGFDLHGVYPGKDVCPECGRALTENGAEKPRAIRIGNRRRRTGWISLSCSAVVLALAIGGLGIWELRQGGGWNPYKPNWWLMMDTNSGRTSIVDAALKELQTRSLTGTLADHHKKTLVERGLAWQADASKPWIDAWGTVVEAAWMDGSLNDVQKKSYAAHAATVKLRARATVRQGDRVAASIQLLPRVGSAGLFSFGLELKNMKLGEQRLLGMPFDAFGALDPRPAWGGSAPGIEIEFAPEIEPNIDMGVSTQTTQKLDAAVNVTPGEYTLQTSWDFTVRARDSGAMAGTMTWGRKDPQFSRLGMLPFGKSTTEVFSTENLDLTAPVRAVGPSEETVELVTDEKLAATVQAAVTVSIHDEPAMTYSLSSRRTNLCFGPAPVDFAFDVTVRCGTLEKHGYALSNSGLGGGMSSIDAPTGAKGATYDVILTPSPKRARRTVGMTRIWGKEIVVKGLSVQKYPAMFGGMPAGAGGNGGGAGEESGIEIMAYLKLPPGDRFPGNHAFRSVALKMPMVYVGDRQGDIYVFKVEDENRNAPKDALRVIKKAGDGNDLKVIGDALLCSKNGRLTIYSLKNPEEPERAGAAGAAEKFLSESLVVEGDTLFLLGQSAIRCFDVSDPMKPSEISTSTFAEWPRAGCVRGNRLYAVETGFGPNDSRVGVYDISELSEVRRVGSVVVKPAPFAVHLLEGDELLAVLDAPTATLSGVGPWGSTAVLNVKDDRHPRIAATYPASGGRASAMLAAADGTRYFAVPGAILRMTKDGPETVMPLHTGGVNLDGAAYHGDADKTHLAVVTDEAVVIIRLVPKAIPSKIPVPSKEGEDASAHH